MFAEIMELQDAQHKVQQVELVHTAVKMHGKHHKNVKLWKLL